MGYIKIISLPWAVAAAKNNELRSFMTKGNCVRTVREKCLKFNAVGFFYSATVGSITLGVRCKVKRGWRISDKNNVRPKHAYRVSALSMKNNFVNYTNTNIFATTFLKIFLTIICRLFPSKSETMNIL